MNIATYDHVSDGNLHVTIQYRRLNFAKTSDSQLPFYEETPDPGSRDFLGPLDLLREIQDAEE